MEPSRQDIFTAGQAVICQRLYFICPIGELSSSEHDSLSLRDIISFVEVLLAVASKRVLGPNYAHRYNSELVMSFSLCCIICFWGRDEAGDKRTRVREPLFRR